MVPRKGQLRKRFAAVVGPQLGQVFARDIVLSSFKKELQVTFSDGSAFRYPAELLRVESPAANSGGKTQGKTVVAGRQDVGIIGIQRIGSYAIRIQFDDLHASGIFSWSFLHELGVNKRVRIRQYLSKLKAAGLTRDPRKLVRQ